MTTYTTIISSSDLLSNFASDNWRIIDCRHRLEDPAAGLQTFVHGHIPGAIHLHLDEHLSGPKHSPEGRFQGRHPLPSQQSFALLIGQLGINHSTQVIAYDDSDGIFAARLWWMMRWLGHQAVAVLDGGLAAWLGCCGELTTQGTKPLTASQAGYAPRPGTHPVDVHTVLQNVYQPEFLLIDARHPERFAGNDETLDPVGGHIPQAINIFYKNNLDQAGNFKSSPELQEQFQVSFGRWSADKIVSQCGSGVTACHNLLAMEIAGLPGARLYPGSWSQWCADSERPVATGHQS